MEFSLPSTVIGGGSAIILLILGKVCKNLKLHLQANGVNVDLSIDGPSDNTHTKDTESV